VSNSANGGSADVLDHELRADALDVLGDVVRWRLTTHRWGSVTAAVAALADALRAGDAGAFRAALYELELTGPVRGKEFGTPAEITAPDPVREEINALVDDLGLPAPARPED
jgi:hypothetical protein